MFYAAVAAGADGPTDLMRCSPERSGFAWLGPHGWESGGEPAFGVRLRELTPTGAAELADQLCARWYRQLYAFGEESDMDDPGLRLARVFDRAGSGQSHGAR